MGLSSNRPGQPQPQPLQGLPASPQAPTPLPPAPPPFQFAPPPSPVLPYQTPPRQFGSGTGAQPAFASAQAPGFNPVQAFLAAYPASGNPGGVQAMQQQMQQAMQAPRIPAPLPPQIVNPVRPGLMQGDRPGAGRVLLDSIRDGFGPQY